MSHDDFDFEPIRGLPALLPEGEQLLWQGSPQWKSLAIHAYHVRKVAVYFAVLVLWRIGVGVVNAHSVSAIFVSCAFLVFLGLLAIGVLTLLAYCNARSTVYSITSNRILLRHGIAVPLTMNIPLALINAAELKVNADGSGDIAVSLPPEQRVGYLITWPHLRPGFIAQPRPSFRALSEPEHVSSVLQAAVASRDSVALPRAEDSAVPARVATRRPRVVAAA